jgi:hypothetical protein
MSAFESMGRLKQNCRPCDDNFLKILHDSTPARPHQGAAAPVKKGENPAKQTTNIYSAVLCKSVCK